MSLPAYFPPPRRTGLIFHASAIIFLAALIALSIYLASQLSTGATFMLLLALALIFLIPLLFLIYRGYALMRGGYTLEREGLRLRWGLRAEDIPLPQIEWVRPASEMGFDLPLPPFALPGAIIGSRDVEGIGIVEYMASDLTNMLLVATPQKVYAISPANTKTFFNIFRNIMELGSPSPLQPYSSLPIVFLQKVWSDRLARLLILLGVGLMLFLFLATSIMTSAYETISIGFDAQGTPETAVPSERLLLLPVICTFTNITDLLAGLLFYWRTEKSPVAYLLWGSGVLTPFLLFIALLFML